MNKFPVAWIGVVLALTGLLWTASGKWQEIQDRVQQLEKQQQFMWGPMPQKGL